MSWQLVIVIGICGLTAVGIAWAQAWASQWEDDDDAE